MSLRLRFNLILTAVFCVGLIVSGWVSYSLLRHNAREEAIRAAQFMIETARAIRAYTIDEVRPNLADHLDTDFLPQAVPAYAATTLIGHLPERYHDYQYKEATLNPTNPRNRAADWEIDLVEAFKRDSTLKSLTGERETPQGHQLFIASPLVIRDEACLACHGTPSEAPAPMLARYGDTNGFGWRLNEIIGAQVVSVPLSVPVAKANQAFLAFMGSLIVVFVALYVALNWMLSRLIVRPISSMSRAADEVSTGNFDIAEFEATADDEIGRLAKSFNRMRRSLEHAMKMIES